MRLEKVEERYNGLIELRWKSYALVMGQVEARPITAHSREGRRDASRAEPDAPFQLWDKSKPYINSSLPALEAAKCAQLQGPDAFRAYHSALFRGFFVESRDISDPRELIDLAEQVGLDKATFKSDMESAKQKVTAIAEHLELLSEYGQAASGVPMIIVDGLDPIVGAASVEIISRVVDRALEQRALA